MQPIHTFPLNFKTMKKALIYLFCLALALLSCYISTHAQAPPQAAGLTEKIGDMYITFNDSTKRNEFFQIFNQQGCPPNVYVHDTMWQWCDGGLRNTRPPNDCPAYFLHDTLYLPSGGTTTPPPPTITSLFTTQTLPTVTVNDNAGVTLGVRLTTSKAGFIKGVRFYKVAGTTGTHTGLMYSTTGTLLQQIVFTETASGWQYATFITPQAVTAGQSFIVAYFSSTGVYPNTLNGFATAITNTPLTAPASTTAAPNGLYHYGTAPAFTDATYNKTNYWVDALYSAN